MSNFFYTDHATPAQIQQIQQTVLSSPAGQQALADYKASSGSSAFSQGKGNIQAIGTLYNALKAAGLPDNMQIQNGADGPHLVDSGGVNWGNIFALSIGGVATAGALGAFGGAGGAASGAGTGGGVGIGETAATTGLTGTQATALLGGVPAAAEGLSNLPSRQTTPNSTDYMPSNPGGSQINYPNPTTAPTTPNAPSAPNAAKKSNLSNLLMRLAAAGTGAGLLATNGPGSNGTGTNGSATGNYPPELQQLLSMSLQRMSSQQPLFDALNKQAMNGLPRQS